MSTQTVTIAERVRASRAAQGLPEFVADDATLERVGAVLRATRKTNQPRRATNASRLKETEAVGVRHSRTNTAA